MNSAHNPNMKAMTETNASGAQVPYISLCPFCGSPCRTAKDGDGWPSIECTNRDCYATIVFQNADGGEPLKDQRDYADTIRLFNTRHSEVGRREESEIGRVYKWEIEPHPYTNEFDVYVTDSDDEARQAILHAAEMYLWDGNKEDDDGPPHGKARFLKVTHNSSIGRCGDE